jgi:hypothetical protein
MKLKVPVSKTEKKTSNPEVKTTDDNTTRMRLLTLQIDKLEDQIRDLTATRIGFVKERFLLENVPYKEGDKVVFNTSTYKDNIDLVTGILEYDDYTNISPCFYVRPYKKGTEELANTRRMVYNKEQIVKFA